MSYSIESMRAGDAATRHRLGRQAFGGTNAFDPDAPALRDGQIVAAYDGDRLAGSVVTLDFVQTWGGTGVRCGGVSGVLVAPEDRGSGLARRMLTESLDRMAEQGQVISALYPTTATLYRSVGYEVVAMFARRWLELATVPSAPASRLRWEEVGFDDRRLPSLIAAHAALHDGWVVPDPVFWDWRAHSWANDKETNRYAYIGSDTEGPQVGLVFSYTGGGSSRDMFDIVADVVVAPDEGHIAAALGFLAGHTTTAGRAQTTLPDTVLARHLPHPQRSDHANEWPWMLRIVDAPAAITARGFPRGVSGCVELALTDDVRTANSGNFVLDISEGAATLTPGGSGVVQMTIQDLAVVYGGGTSTLLASGRLAGADASARDLLRAAFVSNPTLPIFF